MPQRFLWLPATDPEAADDRPADPEPIRWQSPLGPFGVADLEDDSPEVVLMDVCQEAWAALDGARVARLRGKGDALDAHSGYTRLKVAAALGLLNGRANVSAEDWELAGHLMTVSDRTRAAVAATLAKAKAEHNAAVGKFEAARDEIRSSTAAESAVRRACGKIRSRLAKAPGGWAPRRDLKDAIGRDRDSLREALARLESTGVITAETVGGKGGYRLKRT